MAQRDIDKTPADLRNEFITGLKRRMENLAEASEDTGARLSEMAGGVLKEELFGIPGMLADVTEATLEAGIGPQTMNMLYKADPKFKKAVGEFQDEYGAVGLAAKAGVEFSDEMFDEKGEFRPEMAGRFLAPGALYVKSASLASKAKDILPELSSGVASYISRLTDQGFFPPQPQTAGGPSIMRSERADGAPRSTVVESRAAGEGSGTGGPRKVQSEKEDMFVSPDNEAVVPTVKDRTDSGSSAFSETGIYSPLRAALENIEIPTGGITAAKLLEKLRGQPRAGTELRSLGIEGYLKSKGDKKISLGEFRDVVDVLSPRYKVKTVFEDTGVSYNGNFVAPERTAASTMQRLGNSTENQQNYGVMLFADDSAQIDGSFIAPPAHDYFGDRLPGFFGHVRFSVQDILDPKSNAPLRALVVEEIQTDTVKAFNRMDQEAKANPIPSVDEIIQRKMSGTGYGLLDAPPTIEEALETQRILIKARNDKMKQAISGKTEYGPMQRMQEVILNADPNYKTLNQMLEDTRAVAKSQETLDSSAMQSIDKFFDSGGGSHGSASIRSSISQDQSVFLLQQNLHKARSLSEAEVMIRGLPADSLPLPRGDMSRFDVDEIREKQISDLLDDWKTAHQSAERRLSFRTDGGETQRQTGVFARMFGGGGDIERQMETFRAESIAESALTRMRMKHKQRAAGKFSERFEDELLELRSRPGRTPVDESDTLYNPVTPLYATPDLQRGSVSSSGARQAQDSKELAPDKKYRKSIRYEEHDDIAKAIGEGANYDSKTLFPGLTDMKEEILIEANAMSQLHPALAQRVAKDRPLFEGSIADRTYNSDLLSELGMSKTFAEAQQRAFKRGLINELDAAQQRAPNFETLRKNINKVLTDEGIGPSFVKKLGLEELPPTAAPEVSRALLNNDMDSLSDVLARAFQDGQQFSGASRARDMAARPPYMNQNDFMQFATRVLPVEAKKMGLDMVIVPPKEEFMAARSSDVGGARDVAAFNAVLEGEDTARRAAQILRKRAAAAKKNDAAPTEFKSQQEVDDFLDEAGVVGALRTEIAQSVQRQGIAGDFEKLAKAIEGTIKQGDIKKVVAPNVSFVNERKLRGHFQNYGKNLDAALSKLNKSGVKVEEATEIKFANPDPSGMGTLGKYASGEATRGTGFGFQPSLPPFRIIDLRDPGTAQVAKKVPSAYKDGGPVDLRPKKLVHSGIGAMAKQVM